MGALVFDGDERVVGVGGLRGGPPLAVGDGVAGRWSVGRGRPGDAQRLHHAFGEGIELALAWSDPVDGDDAGGDDGNELGCAVHFGLLGDEGADGGGFVAGHIDEEDVGDIFSDGDLHFADDGALHDVDGGDLHDAEAERSEESGGGVAGAVEVGEAVAENGRQMQACAFEEQAKEEEGERRGGKQDQQNGGEADGEDSADADGVGDTPGEKDEADQDDEDGDDFRDGVFEFVEEAIDEGIVGDFDSAAEDEDGADAADIEQRWQCEEQRREQARSEAEAEGVVVDAEGGRDAEKFGEEEGEGELHAKAEDEAEDASAESQQERLQKVDLDDLTGACAEGLHDGDGVEPLLQVGAHGHGDADGSEDESDEAHE